MWWGYRTLPLKDGARRRLPRMWAQAGLEAKVCMRSYKMFFVAGTEDWFVRRSGGKTTPEATKTIKDRDWKAAKSLFDEWVDTRLRSAEEGEQQKQAAA
jgi:paired amphipathic helix protein Sin3a